MARKRKKAPKSSLKELRNTKGAEERLFRCSACTPRRVFSQVVTQRDIDHIKCPVNNCKGEIEDITEEWLEKMKTAKKEREARETKKAKL